MTQTHAGVLERPAAMKRSRVPHVVSMTLTSVVMALSPATVAFPDPPPQTRNENQGSRDERLERIEAELERQRQENAELRRELETLQRRQFEMDQGPEERFREGEPAGTTLPERAARSTERFGSQGGLYAKPFLRRAERSAHLGGYIDLEYFDSQDSDRRFSQHRFIPFIYVDATDQLKFAAEIEFEFGGSDSPGGDGETKVEFATMDYIFHEALAFRAGAILVPVGKFNLIHDSPVNDLTDRPLVNRFVIPTTLTEAGLGFFGQLPSVGEWEFSYEAYLVNGFRGLDRDGTSRFNENRGLRGGRASLEVDSNNSTAGVGRLSISPFLGTEIGASVHAGKYDEAGDNWLVLWALDLMFKPGRLVQGTPLEEYFTGLELQGELASAEIERNTLARDSGVPDEVWGVYGQVNYHFMFDWLADRLPAVFKQESTFTAVTRIDHVELGTNREERITFGLNFRPIEDTVFKFDYQLNFEDWNRGKEKNDTFAFSVATYF